MSDTEALVASLTEKEHGFTHVRDIAQKIWGGNAASRVWRIAWELYGAPEYQKRMCAVFLFGMLAVNDGEALKVLKDEVAKDENWRVQEILAQALDYWCRERGYRKALPEIKRWLKADNPNTRRAVTEGLRVWTKRPYFKEHPEVAVGLISSQAHDPNDYVRKSARNALRDVRRTHPELVADL